MESASGTAAAGARRGRGWVALALALALIGLGWGIVEISTQKPAGKLIDIAGGEISQETFGGVPQEGDRLGSADAPVTIQLFADLQCSSCREDFLGLVPGLVDDHVRGGDVKLLYRHYSVSQSPQELGFYGAEAAAAQGYGWQYAYLFFRNQDEAQRHGRVDEDFLAAVAAAIPELDLGEWRSYLDSEGGPDGAIGRTLERDNQLGTDLRIRTRPAAVVTGPRGTRTLQDGPSLAQVEAAIEAVR